MVSLFVVELVVTGVPATSRSCDHGTGLPRCIVPWALERQGPKGGVTATGLGLGQTSAPQHLSSALWLQPSQLKL